MENELDVLVIDLGDYCVVKVEKGEIAFKIGEILWLLYESQAKLMYKDFNAIREAIEQKPVPRIEVDGNRMNYYRVVTNHVLESPLICLDTYKALSQLAGKPLPVWKGGKWERLPKTSEYIGDPLDGTGVTIWRFTR
jgi:hypothetical protein